MLTHPSHLAYIVLSPIFSTMFGILNIVTMFILSARFRLESLSQIVLMHICFCDLFVCMISNTFYVANLVHPVDAWSTGPLSCKMFKFCTMLVNVAQIFLLCVLNADRLRRLVNSTTPQWNKRHGLIFATVCWLSAIALCAPRIILFDEKVINGSNGIAIHKCKPIGMDKVGLAVTTFTTFVLAYALPSIFIIYTLVRSQIFMWRRRRFIHISNLPNTMTKMNSRLALTFNLTGAMYMSIWTPFFVMTLLDLQAGLADDPNMVHENFALRCTLLILGSAKPLIYLVGLDKFRNNFCCTQLSRKETITSTLKQTEEVQISESRNKCIKTDLQADSRESTA